MAKLNFGVTPTSVVLRVKLLDSSVTTGAGLTGLVFNSAGLIISTIQIAEATATAYTTTGGTIETVSTLGTYAAPTATKCRFKEVDATNHKGVYEIQFADARFSSTGSLLISVAGATSLAQADFEVQCSNLATNVTQWLGTAASTPTVAGVPNVNAKTWNDLTTVALPATPTNITAGTITTATNVTTVNGLAANVVTAAAIANDALDALTFTACIGTGTCAALGSTTSVIASSIVPSSIVNDQFNGRIIIFDRATTTTALRGQATDITDYVHATLTFTVTALTTAPVSGDTFHIL